MEETKKKARWRKPAIIIVSIIFLLILIGSFVVMVAGALTSTTVLTDGNRMVVEYNTEMLSCNILLFSNVACGWPRGAANCGEDYPYDCFILYPSERDYLNNDDYNVMVCKKGFFQYAFDNKVDCTLDLDVKQFETGLLPESIFYIVYDRTAYRCAITYTYDSLTAVLDALNDNCTYELVRLGIPEGYFRVWLTDTDSYLCPLDEKVWITNLCEVVG